MHTMDFVTSGVSFEKECLITIESFRGSLLYRIYFISSLEQYYCVAIFLCNRSPNFLDFSFLPRRETAHFTYNSLALYQERLQSRGVQIDLVLPTLASKPRIEEAENLVSEISKFLDHKAPPLSLLSAHSWFYSSKSRQDSSSCCL
jgi:hypothetical protein